MQPMHGIIPYMFDFWADPFVYLLLPTKELHDSADELTSS